MGSPASQCDLPQCLVLEQLVGDDALEAGVLALGLFQPLGVIGLMPPYWALQRWKVCSETSRVLATSGTCRPSARSL